MEYVLTIFKVKQLSVDARFILEDPRIAVFPATSIESIFFLGGHLCFVVGGQTCHVFHHESVSTLTKGMSQMRSILDQGIDEYLQEQEREAAPEFEDEYLAKTSSLVYQQVVRRFF